jgi:hypothetical protein
MAGWLSRINITQDDYLNADMLNFLGIDVRNWGGDVNGGGFQLTNVRITGAVSSTYSPSPLNVTQTSGGGNVSVTQYSTAYTGEPPAPAPVARWAVGKDGTSEGGFNSGSNFAIVRYQDNGTPFAGTPLSIERSTGIVSLGQQLWTANVNGGGKTLSNVVIPGMLSDPTNAKGDIVARTDSALARVPVGQNDYVLVADSGQATGVKWAPNTGAVSSVFGRVGAVTPGNADYTAGPAEAGKGLVVNAVSTALSYPDPAWITSLNWSKIVGVPSPGFVLASRNVFAGAGMSGGGPLTADVTLNALVTSVFGRTGAVVLTPSDVAGAGGVPSTRQVLAGSGMSGGGALSADVTLNAAVQSVFGRTGAIALTGTDVSSAGGVLQTRTVASGSVTISGGGDLSANRGLEVRDDTTVQRVRISKDTALVSARREINFVQGSNIILSVNEVAGSNRVDVAIAALGGTNPGPIDPTTAKGDMIVRSANLPSGTLVRLPVGLAGEVLTTDLDQPLGVIWKAAPTGQPQTPWLSDIYGGGFNLYDVGSITATGLIKSTTGGIGFPDGTTQGTAGVLPTVQVLAGAGMTGGGALSGDVTLNAKVTSVQGRIGDVTLTAEDISSSGGVPSTRRVNAGTGMTGGGPLSADVTLNADVVSVNGRTGAVTLTSGDITGVGGLIDPTTTKGDLIVRESASVIKRLPVGTNGQVLSADSAQTVGVKWVTSAGQTPWAQNIDGAGFTLTNTGNIGVGTATVPASMAVASRSYISIKGTTDMGVLELVTNGADGDSTPVGSIAFTDPLNTTVGDKRLASITVFRSGATALNRGSFMQFNTRADGSAAWTERMRISNAGSVGIGTTGPNRLLEVFSSVSTTAPARFGNASCNVDIGAIADLGYGVAVNARSWGLSLQTADTTKLFIANAGNVGIGTTSPGAPLHVVSSAVASASGQEVLRLTATHDGGVVGSGARINFYASPTLVAQIASVTEGAGAIGLSFRPYSNGTFPDALHITTSGNIGIGRPDPQGTLDIYKPLGEFRITSTSTGNYVRQWMFNTENQLQLGIEPASGGVCVSGTLGGAAFLSSVIGGKALHFAVGNGTRMTIGSDGNVGIGLNNPQYLLHVKSSASAVAITSENTAAGGFAQFRIVSDSRAYQFSVGGSTSGWGGNLYIYDETAGSARLLMNSSGQLGIGTIGPTAKLHVVGDLKVGANAYTGSIGDIGVSRDPAPATGAIYFGNAGQYIYYDGTKFVFSNTTTNLPGGVTTQTNPGASINVASQNTTGKAMFVACSINPGGAGNWAAYADSTGNPSTKVGEQSVTQGAQPFTLQFWVLPGHYWKVTGPSGNISNLQVWY